MRTEEVCGEESADDFLFLYTGNREGDWKNLYMITKGPGINHAHGGGEGVMHHLCLSFQLVTWPAVHFSCGMHADVYTHNPRFVLTWNGPWSDCPAICCARGQVSRKVNQRLQLPIDKCNAIKQCIAFITKELLSIYKGLSRPRSACMWNSFSRWQATAADY